MEATSTTGLIAAACLAFCTSLPAQARTGHVANMIITNGHLFPTSSTDARATALAIRGDRILAVGSDAAMLRFKGSGTRLLDAGGRAVLPGFDDNHVHIAWGAMSLGHPDVRTAPGLAAIQQIIRQEAEAHSHAAWVQAGGWLPAQLPEQTPTREMLDAAVADRPVVLWSLDRHSAWLNSKGLAAAGITDDTPDPPQGRIVRDRQGHATGWLKEFTAIDIVERAMPPLSRAERERLMRKAFAEAHSYGVTAFTQAGGSPDEYDLLDSMRKAGSLSVRVTYALLVRPGFTDRQFDRYQAFWKAHPGDDMLKTGTVKLFMDGVPQSDTAFLLRPYGPQRDLGRPNFDPAEYFRLARKFDGAGWQLMVHAIGDGAVKLALDGIAAAQVANPPPSRGRRHRIEHVVLLDPTDAARFASLGVTAAFQPSDVFRPAGTPVAALDPKRPPQDGARWNAIAAAGGRFALGSDWPVFTMDALARIYAIAYSARGDQRVPLAKLIRAYTAESAFTAFDERRRGSLTPGMYADIAIPATDILDRPPTAKQDIRIDATIFGGKLVYVRPGVNLGWTREVRRGTGRNLR